MDNVGKNSSPVARAIPVILFFVGLLGIYYLYQFLFGPSTANEYVLLSEEKAADVEPSKPIVIAAEKLPLIYEGGEFTVSTWFYISNWNHRANRNKAIFRLGGSSFDTLRIYLGGRKPKLHVRIQTSETGATSPTTTPGDPGMDLRVATLAQVFDQLQTDSSLLDSPSPMCDLPEVDLQRWVNLVVSVNGRTTDVYLDGKLVRSCVLPSFYKVDASGYSAHLFPNGGFGGYMAGTRMYDAALNPDTIYRNYIAGPKAITNLGDWIRSLFQFGVNISVESK